MSPRCCILSLCAACLLANPAAAFEGFAIELGEGDESTKMLRGALRWNWTKQWDIGANWTVGGFWEVGLGYWNGGGREAKDLMDIGVTPVFRFSPRGSNFFLEAAIGAHLLSETRINRKREFGSSFNFGDHIGFGGIFGDRKNYEVGYRFQHLSNGSIAQPNDGINFHQVRLGFNY